MTARSKSVIKSYFQRGLKPTQQQYEDLIDSYQDASSVGGPLESTSSTSVLIGTGTKSFVTETDKQFDAGTWLLAYSASTPTAYVHGQSTSYSGGNLSINVTNTGGIGTYNDWVISVSGTQGPQGATGPQGPAGSGSGDVLGPGSSTDSQIALWNLGTGTQLKAATGTGYVKVVSGVYQTPSATIPLTDLASQAARTVLVNATNASAAPTAFALTSKQFLICNDAGTALIAGSFGTGLSVAAGVVTATSSVSRYSSPEQTITANGSLTLSHGLGTTPKIITTWLVCQSAEYGYSVGDRLFNCGEASSATVDGLGHSLVADSSNINIRYGAAYVSINKSTGVGVFLTNSSWKLVIEAWA